MEQRDDWLHIQLERRRIHRREGQRKSDCGHLRHLAFAGSAFDLIEGNGGKDKYPCYHLSRLASTGRRVASVHMKT